VCANDLDAQTAKQNHNSRKTFLFPSTVRNVGEVLDVRHVETSLLALVAFHYKTPNNSAFVAPFSRNGS